MGHFDAARAFYERSLAIAEQHFGPLHPEVATIYHNLGGLKHARGCLRGRRAVRATSVEIRERIRGSDHVDVAADVPALAAILDGLRRYEESEPFYRITWQSC